MLLGRWLLWCEAPEIRTQALSVLLSLSAWSSYPAVDAGVWIPITHSGPKHRQGPV